MININEYNSTFKAEFENSEICKQLKNDFSQLSWENHYTFPATPRQLCGDPTTKMSMVPFYYLNYLLDKNPKEIYDLGCGWNIFKKYIPNIIGVGAEDPNSPDFFGDIHDVVDDEFIAGHQNYFESVFAINSLHFISLDLLSNRVSDFVSMIRPGGRGFLTLNLIKMLERTAPDYLITTFQTQKPTKKDADNYVRIELGKLNFNWLVFDVTVFEKLDDGMDGNIRLVIERN